MKSYFFVKNINFLKEKRGSLLKIGTAKGGYRAVAQLSQKGIWEEI